MMNEDEKTCPKCAETVKAAAVICKHCGFNFQTQASPENSAEYAKKKDMQKGKGCLIVLGIIAALWVISTITGGSESSTGGESKSAEQAAPPVPVTARELEAAYSANEAAAQQKYGGKRLLVSGTIQSIDLGLADEPFVVLRGENMFMGPQLHLADSSKPRASSLSKGEKIAAICGEVSEVVGTPMLKDCEIQ